MPLKMKYFVLKPAGKKNHPFAEASRAAMLMFADKIESTDKILAEELREWVQFEITNSQSEEQYNANLSI